MPCIRMFPSGYPIHTQAASWRDAGRNDAFCDSGAVSCQATGRSPRVAAVPVPTTPPKAYTETTEIRI